MRQSRVTVSATSAGSPAACHSTTTLGSPSYSEGRTIISMADSSRGTSRDTPVKITRSPIPSSLTFASTAERSGPSPTSTRARSGFAFSARAKASTRNRWFFCSTMPPTWPMTVRSPTPSCARQAARAPGSKR